jgi:hypothetical protein
MKKFTELTQEEVLAIELAIAEYTYHTRLNPDRETQKIHHILRALSEKLEAIYPHVNLEDQDDGIFNPF